MAIIQTIKILAQGELRFHFGFGLPIEAQEPQPLSKLGLLFKIRQRPTLPYGNRIVPSALEGLTAEFGMGSGVTPPLSPPENFEIFSHN